MLVLSVVGSGRPSIVPEVVVYSHACDAWGVARSHWKVVEGVSWPRMGMARAAGRSVVA